ncbi:MAG: PP2C family protein-serine/threonine phosphatase [Oscillospiraceae bacterium]
MKLSLRQKTVCMILLLALALTITAAAVGYDVYAGTMDAHYQMLAMNVSKTAASLVNAEEVRELVAQVMEIYRKDPAPTYDSDEAWAEYLSQYTGISEQESFTTLYDTLYKIKTANNVLSLYISYMDSESMTGIYIIDADKTETGCPTGTWDIIYPQNYEAMKHPENGFEAYITDTEEYGWLCSAGAAVLDDSGKAVAHVFTDISMESVMADRQAFLMRLCAILIGITTVITLALIKVVNAALVKPINSLASAASSYVEAKEEGEVSALALLDIHTGDEVENLSHALKRMERDINGYIENLTHVTAEKERIGAELSVATHIQASMLPCIFPAFPNRREFDIYATMTPAKEVGGDFYDFFLVDDDHLAVVIADVSGKGVPAALFMVIAKTLIKDHTQSGKPPEEVFTEVNRQLCEANDENLFVTAWMGVLEISTGKLVYVNAGHNPPVIGRKNGETEFLRSRPGFVLAGLDFTKYRAGSLELMPGDLLYLYTDGVTEAMNTAQELYGEERLKRTLDANVSAAPEEIFKAVKKDLDDFVADAPQFDDITMLAMRYLGREGG